MDEPVCSNCGVHHDVEEMHLVTEIGVNEDGDATVGFYIYDKAERIAGPAVYTGSEVRQIFINTLMHSFASEASMAQVLSMRMFKFSEEDIGKVMTEAHKITEARRQGRS